MMTYSLQVGVAAPHRVCVCVVCVDPFFLSSFFLSLKDLEFF